MVLRVLELFSGIGGMHFALEKTEIEFEVVAAIEINSKLNEIYSHNFGEGIVQNKNIVSLSSDFINSLNIDLITMSMPCQPYSRNGNRLDIKDERSNPFKNIMDILEKVSFKYILIENVQGFEESESRQILLNVMKKCNFNYQEFLICPTSINIPNSRLRYYLIGKKNDVPWLNSTIEIEEDIIQTKIPCWENLKSAPYIKIVENEEKIWKSQQNKLLYKKQRKSLSTTCNKCIEDVLEDLSPEEEKEFLVKEKHLKYLDVMDIRTLDSESTCCFTKGYMNYFKGTGSILDLNNDNGVEDNKDYSIENKNLKLRYFTPKEISRLMSFPEKFNFPKNISLKERYKSLGNSLNCYVVAILFFILLN